MNPLSRTMPAMLFALAVTANAGNNTPQQPAYEPQPLSIQEQDWSVDDSERWCDSEPELYANLMSFADIDPFAATVCPRVMIN